MPSGKRKCMIPSVSGRHYNVFPNLSLFTFLFTEWLRSSHPMLQSCAVLNWNYFRFRCSCTPVPVNWYFVAISPYFAIFKNVVQSLEPGETPSYSPYANSLDLSKTRNSASHPDRRCLTRRHHVHQLWATLIYFESWSRQEI